MKGRALLVLLLLANLAFLAWTRLSVPSWEAVTAAPGSAALARASADPPQAPAVDTAGVAGPSAETDTSSCVRLEGFRDVEALRAVAGHPGLVALSVSLPPPLDGGPPGGHWVFVHAPATEAARTELLERLRGAGVPDAYVMPADSARRISIGVFSDARRASARVAELNLAGISAQSEDRTAAAAAGLWIEISGSLPPVVDRKVLESWGSLDPAIRIQPCP